MLQSAPDGGRTAAYAPSGPQGTLTNDSGTDILTLADDTTVSGVRFEGGQRAIHGENLAGRFLITHNTIANPIWGIDLAGLQASEVTVLGNQIETPGDSTAIYVGIDALSSTEPVRLDVSKNTIPKTYEVSLQVDVDAGPDAPVDVRLQGNTIGDNYFGGIELELNAQGDAGVSAIDNFVGASGDDLQHGNYYDQIDLDLNVAGRSQTTVRGNTVADGYYGRIRINLSGSPASAEVAVTDNVVGTSHYESLDLDLNLGVGGGTADVSRNVIAGSTDTAGLLLDVEALRSEGSPLAPVSVTLSANQIQGGRRGLALSLSNTGRTQATLTGNVIEEAQEVGMGVSLYTTGDPEAESALSITNNTVGQAGKDGIELELSLPTDAPWTLAVRENEVGSAGGYGIDVGGTAQGRTSLSLTGNTVGSVGTSVRGTGIAAQWTTYADSVVHVSSNSIAEASGDGFDLGLLAESGTITATVSGNSVGDVAESGVDLYLRGEVTGTVSGNTLATSGGHGIEVTNSANLAYVAHLAVQGNDIGPVGGDGIYVEIDNSASQLDAAVTENVVEDAGGWGMAFHADPLGGTPTIEVSIDGNTIEAAVEGGILLNKQTADFTEEIGENTFGPGVDPDVLIVR